MTQLEERTKPQDIRNALIGILVVLVVGLAAFASSLNAKLDSLEARLSTPECYSAFGDVHQQCLADFLPWYDDSVASGDGE